MPIDEQRAAAEMQEKLAAIADQVRGGSVQQKETRAASFLRERMNQAATRMGDPSLKIPGMAPNMGQYVLPHVTTVAGIVSAVSKTYRISDEALLNSFDDARFMLFDCGIMECVEARNRSVALLNWHLEPEDEKSQEQKDLCEEHSKIITRTPRFMQWRDSLLRATWFGRNATQHRYQWADVSGRQRILATKWTPIHGDKLVFRYDDGTGRYDPDQIGIRVGQGYTVGDRVRGMNDRQVEPTERGLAYFLTPAERRLVTLHKHLIEDGAFENPSEAGKIHGVGIRSRIYWTWYQKQACLAWLMEYLERSAFGIEVWYYPWGDTDAEEKVRKAASDRIGNGKNIVLMPRPQGEEAQAYGVEHIEPGLGGVDQLFHVLNDYFGHQIKRYILGQTLTSEADATGLGSGVADIHLGTFLDILRYDATNLEETITDDFVTPLKDMNFPAARRHRLRFVIETKADDVAAQMEGFEKAFNMGCRLNESEIMECVGASIPTDSDVVLQSPQFTQIGNGGVEPGAFGDGNQGLPGEGSGWAPDPKLLRSNDRGGNYDDMSRPKTARDHAQGMAEHMFDKLGGVKLPGQQQGQREQGSTKETYSRPRGQRRGNVALQVAARMTRKPFATSGRS